MKKFSIATIIIGAFLIITGVLTPWISLLLMPPAPSVGIIGGADGPTAIFLTSTLWIDSIYGRIIICGSIILIIGIIILIINKLNKK